MIEIKGKYNIAIVYTDNIESSAKHDLRVFCDQEFLAGSKIRVMPDVHTGRGCTIGTTMTIKDAIIPCAVGVDISCAILTVKLDNEYIDLEELDKFIRKNIPSGRHVRDGKQGRPRRSRSHGRIDLTKLSCYKQVKLKNAWEALGTVGAGNHFIELNRSSSGIYYLQVHTGSRNPGKRVAEFYQDLAYSDCGGPHDPSIEHDLSYLTGKHMDDYIHDMKIMQDYASLNRSIIVDDIIEGLGLHEVDRFDTVHNYIDTENMILRKGACAAYEDQLLVIPMNMRDGSLICRGKGNPDWNYSAPHGAGRILSRSAAKKKLNLEDYKDTMKDVFTTCVSKGTLDEAPMAYKPMEEIVSHIRDTVEILEQIKPVYNFKASD